MGNRNGEVDLQLDDGECGRILRRYVPEKQFWVRRIGEQEMQDIWRKESFMIDYLEERHLQWEWEGN